MAVDKLPLAICLYGLFKGQKHLICTGVSWQEEFLPPFNQLKLITVNRKIMLLLLFFFNLILNITKLKLFVSP